MLISELRVKNFRRLKDCTIPLRKHTALIGENNAGKSSVIDLLDTVLNPTRRNFFMNDDDLTHGSDASVDAIELVLVISPDDEESFTQDEHNAFDPHIDLEDNGVETMLIELTHRLNESEGVFRTSVNFLKSDGLGDGPFPLSRRKEFPLLPMRAFREPAREFQQRQGAWQRMLTGLAVDPEAQSDLAAKSAALADDALKAGLGADGLQETKLEMLQVLRNVLWQSTEQGELAFTLSSDVTSLLSSIELLVKNPGDTQPLAVSSLGTGTQSVALMALLLAQSATSASASPVLAVEEPEAHLHPHATRSLAKHLWSSDTQVIVTTHSTYVTDCVEPEEIVRLRRRLGYSEVRFVPKDYFSELDSLEIKRYIRGYNSEFFFARAVLLVEGQTEVSALPVFAKALGIDLDTLGISIVAMDGRTFRPYMRLFAKEALDIPFMTLCDNDLVGFRTARLYEQLGLAKAPPKQDDLDDYRDDLEEAGLHILPEGAFEEYVMSQCGPECYLTAIEQLFPKDAFSKFVERRVAKDGGYEIIPTELQVVDFIKDRDNRRKPELAYTVANLITKDGTDDSEIPAYFLDFLEGGKELAVNEFALSMAE